MRHEQKYLVIPAGLGEASGEEASQFSAPGSSTHGSEPSLGLSMPLSEYVSGYEESEGEKRTCFSWSEERMRASNEVLGVGGKGLGFRGLGDASCASKVICASRRILCAGAFAG